MTDPGGGGHVWAPVHRWGIAVDDGRLTFVDTEDLTIDPSFHHPIPERDRDGARGPHPAGTGEIDGGTPPPAGGSRPEMSGCGMLVRR
ncbi:hypothetical protein [Rhodococcus sp. LB1]|uniref:hypothetical protein n=1 Tax=Rhodococcus sp. LB1 TaxID=1807499 RepID=UPI000AABAA15